MTEITETDAKKMLPEDALCLINWRNCHDEHIVAGFTMQGLLDLYHASAKYMTLEGWLKEENSAMLSYKRIKRSPTKFQSWAA